MSTNRPSHQIGDEASDQAVGRGCFPAMEGHVPDAALKNIAGAWRIALAAAARRVEYSLLAVTGNVIWPASILAIIPPCEAPSGPTRGSSFWPQVSYSPDD